MLLWCLVRHKNPRKIHPERITQSDRKFAKDLDLKDISFPVIIKRVPQIERQNKININVFGYDERDQIGPGLTLIRCMQISISVTKCLIALLPNFNITRFPEYRQLM